LEALRGKAGVVYQGAIRLTEAIDGVQCEIVGSPDFFIMDGDSYVIRDSKISRRINERDHPEILRQLELYGWLYERACGKPPRALEVHSGTGDIVPVAYDGGKKALDALARVLRAKLNGSGVYEPVGWSKCDGCGFFDRCWPQAEARKDIALVGGVDLSLARALYGAGVRSYTDLLAKLDEPQLSTFERPWGKGVQRVGARAGGILRSARALAEGREILLQRPVLPDHNNFVMIDVEGLPPHLDELEKIYLWGLRVYGQEPTEYLGATAGAMARYIEAVETENADERAAVMTEILDYNRDDIAAMWAVFEWLKQKSAAAV
ncbi:MAG TPA: hypothetical protein VFL31_04470, partial [Nitrospiraceae bacterium]|nr:hypothetical protein [Nitrospiraceae bacterium]